jgi:TPR repeat protein
MGKMSDVACAAVAVLLVTVSFVHATPRPDGTMALARHNHGGANKTRLLAERGDARAQTLLGFLHEHGRGVPQDYGGPLVLFRRRARRSDRTVFAWTDVRQRSRRTAQPRTGVQMAQSGRRTSPAGRSGKLSKNSRRVGCKTHAGASRSRAMARLSLYPYATTLIFIVSRPSAPSTGITLPWAANHANLCGAARRQFLPGLRWQFLRV